MEVFIREPYNKGERDVEKVTHRVSRCENESPKGEIYATSSVNVTKSVLT